MSSEFDLMVAPNGARKTKADHPALPMTSAELAETARACAEAGAGAIHVHVRDADGAHSLDAVAYREAVAAVRAACDLRVQITTEAAGAFDVGAQIDCLGAALAPEASVALREIEREPERLAEAYRVADEAGVSVQHILYAPEDLVRLKKYLADGVVPARFSDVLFVLGRYAQDQRSVPEDLDPFLEALDGAAVNWSVCAFGAREHDCLLYALHRGGGVRVGFENNHLAPDGAPFRDNAASVASFVAAAARIGFTPRRTIR